MVVAVAGSMLVPAVAVAVAVAIALAPVVGVAAVEAGVGIVLATAVRAVVVEAGRDKPEVLGGFEPLRGPAAVLVVRRAGLRAGCRSSMPRSGRLVSGAEMVRTAMASVMPRTAAVLVRGIVKKMSVVGAVVSHLRKALMGMVRLAASAADVEPAYWGRALGRGNPVAGTVVLGP